MKVRLPIPSKDMQIRSVDIKRPKANDIIKAREYISNEKLFDAAVVLVASGTGLKEDVVNNDIPWRSVEWVLANIFALAGISTELTGTYLCPDQHVNKYGGRGIDVREMPVHYFDGDVYEESFFTLEPFTGTQAKKFIVRGPDETDAQYAERLKWIRVISREQKAKRGKREDDDATENLEIRVKSLTIGHATPSDMIMAWRKSAGGAAFQNELFTSLIAGMEFTCSDRSVQTWKDAVAKFKFTDGGILNFDEHVYSDALIEGQAVYGMKIFFEAFCETCKVPWEQAWSFMSFFAFALRHDSGRRVLEG